MTEKMTNMMMIVMTKMKGNDVNSSDDDGGKVEHN